jgi:hypothetical protein
MLTGHTKRHSSFLALGNAIIYPIWQHSFTLPLLHFGHFLVHAFEDFCLLGFVEGEEGLGSSGVAIRLVEVLAESAFSG